MSILLVYTTFTDHGTIADVPALSVGIIIVYTSYELGYIANDAFTVSKEINPTLRLSENEISWVKLHWLKIIGIRLVITMVLLGVGFIT